MGPVSLAIAVTEPSQAGEARREAAALAQRLGFDETARGRLALVVTEAATNLARHTPGGEVLLRVVEAGRVAGIEVLALDAGPGMADVARCQQDGYSTAGTPGHGLGAMRRLADAFDLHSAPGVGTALYACVWSAPPAPADRPSWDTGSVCRPKPGEEACGDAWAVHPFPDGRCSFVVVDGLGHGPDAAEAARTAIRIFQAEAASRPAAVLEAAHAALRSTRGAAMAVGAIERGRLRFAGIGNIAGYALSEGRRQGLASHNGIVGHQLTRVHEFEYAFEPGALAVLHSDGIGTKWDLAKHAGLAQRHPAVIAGVIHRDFRRLRDDSTVLALRQARPGATR